MISYRAAGARSAPRRLSVFLADGAVTGWRPKASELPARACRNSDRSAWRLRKAISEAACLPAFYLAWGIVADAG
jgi:hypothetical protein